MLDDRGEPVLIDPECFEIVRAGEPPFWITQGEGGALLYTAQEQAPALMLDKVSHTA